MSKIHYFQRYHQKENVVTNNTMLLFSRLYHYSPKKFKKFLEALVDSEFEVEVGVNFSQQERNGDSVPDGIISQESFKIVLETKLHNSFSNQQLINHLNSFKNEDLSVLIALSNVPIDDSQRESLIKKVGDYNQEFHKEIKFVPTTFSNIISVFREELSDFDIELNDVIEDFEDFCLSAGLLPKEYPRMLIVPCGQTLADNIKYKVYYDPADRTYSRATHVGIYKNKRVQAIGKISKVVFADYDVDTKNFIVHSSEEVTEDQKQRIIAIMDAAMNTLGWSIYRGHKFFCLDDLELTNFKKTSSGGIMGKRYENLEAKTGLTKEATTIEFATALNNETWD